MTLVLLGVTSRGRPSLQIAMLKLQVENEYVVICNVEVASCKVECGNTLKLRNSSVVSFTVQRKCGLKNQVSKL